MNSLIQHQCPSALSATAYLFGANPISDLFDPKPSKDTFLPLRESPATRARLALSQLWFRSVGRREQDPMLPTEATLQFAELLLNAFGHIGVEPTEVAKSAVGGVGISFVRERDDRVRYADVEVLNEGVLLASSFDFGDIDSKVQTFSLDVGGVADSVAFVVAGLAE